MTYDDLLGDDDEPSPSLSLKTIDLHEVVAGVSIPWLVKAFRKGRGAVEKALAQGGCEPVRVHRNGGLYYDLPAAAACLVPPTTNLAHYLKTLKPSDLPEQLKDSFWSARLKEQRWREKAGDLWSTAAVLAVFGDTFKMMKTTTQLWTDTIDETVGLSIEQRDVLTQMVDNLLREIHEELVKGEKANLTRSQLAELDDNA